MKREILFRGKRVDNGEWVYGDLANEPSGIFIRWIYKPSSNEVSWRNFKDMVVPETVGQFSGLTDKNGVKIFEKDIVDCIVPSHSRGDKKKTIRCVVEFSGGMFFPKPICGGVFGVPFEGCEVVGNVFKSPEPIKA